MVEKVLGKLVLIKRLRAEVRERGVEEDEGAGEEGKENYKGDRNVLRKTRRPPKRSLRGSHRCRLLSNLLAMKK